MALAQILKDNLTEADKDTVTQDSMASIIQAVRKNIKTPDDKTVFHTVGQDDSA